MKNILKISPQDGGENDNKRRAFDPPIFLCIMGYAINNIYRRNEMEDDKYEKLSDGEVLDLIFAKFDLDVFDFGNATERLLSKIDTAITYKKYLAHVLYDDALRMSKKELQEVLFFEEETTDSWTLQQCQIQFVKDQISFYESDNLDSEVKETWEKIND
jgi:hypothetical protein